MTATTYQPADRRPAGARHWRLTQWLTDRLAGQGVAPNAISVAGMAAGIGAGAALAATAFAPPGWERVAWLGASALVLARGLANILDGMVAVQTGRASRTGELFNEVPDRVSDTAMLVGAGYAAGGHPALGYAAACVALFTAYVRAVGKAAGGRHEFCGPMAKPHRMYVIVLVALFCGLAPRAWQPAWGEGPTWGVPAVGLAVIIAGGIATAARRLLRTAAALKGGSS